jgi:hypothetical protein
MLTKILIVLAIIPWSVIFGVSYLVYRRVRGQRVQTVVDPSVITTSSVISYGRGTAEEIADFYFDGVPAPEVQTCTRPSPHVCKVNGPCNGWPKEDLMQQKPLEGWNTADADYIAKMGRA